MKKILLAFLALGAAFAVKAQNATEIIPDNMGYTMSPQTLAKKGLQVEGIYSFRSKSVDFANPLRPTYDNRTTFRSTTNSGGINIRYGIFNRLEVSAQYSGHYFDSEAHYLDHEPTYSGEYSAAYRFQIKGLILKGEGLSPALGAGLSYSYGSYNTETVILNIAASSHLTDKIGLRANLGYWLYDTFQAGAQVNYELSKEILVFAEYFHRFIYHNHDDHQYHDNQPYTLSAGLAWQITPNTQLNVFGSSYFPELRIGDIEIDSSEEYALNVSFATRFNLGD